MIIPELLRNSPWRKRSAEIDRLAPLLVDRVTGCAVARDSLLALLTLDFISIFHGTIRLRGGCSPFKGVCVMPGKAPDGWQNLTARELDAQFAMTLQRIGERLAKDASIAGAPLPERMTALLDELRRRRARNRNGR